MAPAALGEAFNMLESGTVQRINIPASRPYSPDCGRHSRYAFYMADVYSYECPDNGSVYEEELFKSSSVYPFPSMPSSAPEILWHTP